MFKTYCSSLVRGARTTSEHLEHFFIFMEQEIWKDIEGYEGYFKISNLGRVMAIERYVKQGNGLRYCKEMIVPHHLNPFCYPCVTLCKEKKSKEHPVHRLIMEAFVPNPENKPHIDHINTDKTDFRISNLRWVTPKENANNPITLKNGRKGNYDNKEVQKRKLETRKRRNSAAAPIEVFQYTKEGVFVNSYYSSQDAQKSTGIYASQIRQVLDDNTQSAGGFMWFSKKHDNLKYKRRLSKNTKVVIEIDGSGKEIKRWDMLKDAAKEIGVTSDNVRKAIKENRKVKGHMVQYGSIIK